VSFALGLDVAVTRGCDAVLLGDAQVARPLGRVKTGSEFRALLDDLAPASVAIDAPPRWAVEKRRACEQELTKRSISLFTTPTEEKGKDNRFYAWMRTGFEMFDAARDHQPLETFPHAVAVAINGRLPSDGKRTFRRAALEAVDIDTRHLKTIDHIDAALCAYTAWSSLTGNVVRLGDEKQGWITLPGTSLLERYVR